MARINAGKGTGDQAVKDTQGNVVEYKAVDRLQQAQRDLHNRTPSWQTTFSGNVESAVGDNGQQAVLISSNPDTDGTSANNVRQVHNYTVINASSGATPAFIVTPGNHKDSTGGSTWVPTIGGVLITNVPGPKANPSTSDTMVWFEITVNSFDGTGAAPAGAITAIEIDFGTAIPSDDNTHVYQLVANILVTVTSGIANVSSLEGGVAGSQVYQACGTSGLLGLQ